MNDPTILPGAEPFAFPGGSLGVLMVHGFGGSPASMRPIGERLAHDGLSVAAPRLPGHGTSVEDFGASRWRDWVAEAERGLDDLRGRCERVVILGHSLGGSIALHLAAERPGDVDGLALTNPYLRDPRLLLVPVGRWFLRTVKAPTRDAKLAGDGHIAYPRRPVPAIVSMRDFLRIVDRQLPSVSAPLIVSRSTEDHVIPAGSTERILARVSSTRTELVPCADSYHEVTIDNDAPMVAERVLAFARDL